MEEALPRTQAIKVLHRFYPPEFMKDSVVVSNLGTAPAASGRKCSVEV